MRANRYMLITVISATILFFVLWQTGVAKPPMKPGNPGVPGLLAEIAELNAQIEELEDLLSQPQDFAPVPKTGQTDCYDTDLNPIDCADTGQDGEYQYGTPCPELRFTDNSNGTVTDNCTGLIWLKNADCFGFTIWATALTDANSLNSGECGLTDGSVEGDWRLPNVKELQSLVDYGNYNPAVPSGHPFNTVRYNFYWSSTTYEFVSGYAWSVDFSNGFVYHRRGKGNDLFVWPVRDDN